VQFGDLAGDFSDKRGFVALSAMGEGRKVGGVGFDQHAVEGNHLRGVADGLRFGKVMLPANEIMNPCQARGGRDQRCR